MHWKTRWLALYKSRSVRGHSFDTSVSIESIFCSCFSKAKQIDRAIFGITFDNNNFDYKITTMIQQFKDVRRCIKNENY